MFSLLYSLNEFPDPPLLSTLFLGFRFYGYGGYDFFFSLLYSLNDFRLVGNIIPFVFEERAERGK